MTTVPLRLRIPFKEQVKPFRCRNLEFEQFHQDIDIGIEEIAPNDAPIAFGVRAFGPSDPKSGLTYNIRSFDGRFWWPVFWNDRLVDRAAFEASAAGASSYALIAIDPSLPQQSHGFPESNTQIDQERVQERGITTRWEREAAATRGALNVIYCGELAFVGAGIPVVYAVDRPAGLELVVGPSDWKRLTSVQVLPGLGQWPAIRSAKSGRVFGLEERDGRGSGFRAEGHRVVSHFDVESFLPAFGSGPAALLCANAIADSALNAAKEGHGKATMLASIPSLFNAGEPHLFLDDVDIRAVLEEMAFSEDARLYELISVSQTDVRDVLLRVRTAGISGLRSVDEEALFATKRESDA